ncbi:uncharacterized protein LOC111499484 [Cucurbita maxima]|uniref:Uncharacterized protein LOC111499484 n=1 Tax=Cucurbita maxima TaxID=3661 RepID=A0A6J1L378_CUCMA|nr:uncharacterized protein LOC111499484 [Cucurbita maxima]
MTEPRRNDNLSPFQAWRSAVECMFNKSIACTEQQQIWLNLTIEVAKEDMRGYCGGGCLEHTMDVLDCIDDVKRDFWFANNFDTPTLRSFLNERCSNSTAFSYKDVPTTTTSGGGRGAFQVLNNMVLSVIIPVLASILSYNYYY